MFKLGDRIYKDILYFYTEDLSTGLPLYVLTQLSDANIEITAESVDVTDKFGNLVKKVWRSKAGTFSATNAFVNTNIVAASSGLDAVFASSGSKIDMPKMMVVKAGTTPITLSDYKADSIKVAEWFGDGSIGKIYEGDTTAGDSKYAITSGGVLTLPTDPDATAYFIKYIREVESGSLIVNEADEFPNSVKAIMKATYFNPCKKNEILADYIEFPSFQVSPEITVPVDVESTTMDFTGDLEIDNCSTEKVLYRIYSAEGVDED